jgi:hypothetical protein
MCPISIALEEGEDLRGPLGRLFEGRPVAAVVEKHEARVGDVVEDPSPATNRSGRRIEKAAGNLANSRAALQISLMIR